MKQRRGRFKKKLENQYFFIFCLKIYVFYYIIKTENLSPERNSVFTYFPEKGKYGVCRWQTQHHLYYKWLPPKGVIVFH